MRVMTLNTTLAIEINHPSYKIELVYIINRLRKAEHP